MFNASDLATRAVSAPDRSPRCPRNEAIVQLLAAAIANFDSDSAKPCIQRAAELLAASGNRHGHRPNEFSASPNGLAPWKAKRVAEYVEANIASKLPAPKLAGVVRLSTAHFFSRVQEELRRDPAGVCHKTAHLPRTGHHAEISRAPFDDRRRMRNVRSATFYPRLSQDYRNQSRHVATPIYNPGRER